MTKDDILRLAREAGSIDSDEVIETVHAAFAAADRADLLSGDVDPFCWGQPTTAGLYISNEKDTVYTMPLFTADQMAAAVAAEREACAKLCLHTNQEYEPFTGQPRNLSYTCADAIRARKKST